jgi:hypothetical protein
MKKILSITGSNWSTGRDVTKQTEIKDEILELITPVLKAITDNKDSYNWACGTYLNKNRKTGEWDTIYLWKKMYCQFSDKQLKTLEKYIPSNIDKITSINILVLDVVSTENIL